MSPASTPGSRFRAALAVERPLQIAGVINAYSALLAQRAGFRALYLSGAGVANYSHGLPDLGITTLEQVLEDARRVTARVDLPLLVDIDTGWDDIGRAVSELGRAGAAAVQVEDQVADKRCGHRPGKELVSAGEMGARVRTAAAARPDPGFVVMARTDAAAVEGLPAAIARAQTYVDAGADMIFAEALESVSDFARFAAAVKAPVLANMTEFGRTPLFTVAQFREAGIAMVLYPLSAARSAAAATEATLAAIRREGTQASVVGAMQTRDRLYETLDYLEHERRADEARGR